MNPVILSPETYGDPISRTPSGMILTSSRENAILCRARSLSAPVTPFSTSNMASCWADEVERLEGLERIQSGLAGPSPPASYLFDPSLASNWSSTEAATVPVQELRTIPGAVVEAHNPYAISGKTLFLVKQALRAFDDLPYDEQLKEIAIHLLENRKVNPFEGSVPLEKIQNILSCSRGPYTDLYHAVVGKGKGKLIQFFNQYPETFEHFGIEDGKWRLRLTRHKNFRFGDQCEKATRQAEVTHLLGALRFYLERQPGYWCKVDDFIEAYEHLPCNVRTPDGSLVLPLPPRGDLVRFVEKHTDCFRYEKCPKTFIIHLCPGAPAS